MLKLTGHHLEPAPRIYKLDEKQWHIAHYTLDVDYVMAKFHQHHHRQLLIRTWVTEGAKSVCGRKLVFL